MIETILREIAVQTQIESEWALLYAGRWGSLMDRTSMVPCPPQRFGRIQLVQVDYDTN